MAFEKVYIAKGSQVPNLPIVRITIPLEKLEQISYERDGVKYVTFEVSKLKEADKFGRDYTVYHSKKVEAGVNEPAPKKKGRKKKQDADLPF